MRPNEMLLLFIPIKKTKATHELLKLLQNTSSKIQKGNTNTAFKKTLSEDRRTLPPQDG